MADGAPAKETVRPDDLDKIALLTVVEMAHTVARLVSSAPREVGDVTLDQRRLDFTGRIYQHAYSADNWLFEGEPMCTNCTVAMIRGSSEIREREKAVGIVNYYPAYERRADGNAGPEEGSFDVRLRLDPDQFDFVCRNLWAGLPAESVTLTLYSEGFATDHGGSDVTVHWPPKGKVIVIEFSVAMLRPKLEDA